jgi:GNAT superfamily N-acetyltransferase
VVVHGFFVDGTLRGAAELRRIGPLFSREAEAAFSIEQPWQSHGVGTALLERTLLSARNRTIKALHMHCLADNRRMQQLARKFEADLTFDFGSVVGEVDPPRFTALSLMREWMADGQGIATAVLDMQERLLRAA